MSAGDKAQEIKIKKCKNYLFIKNKNVIFGITNGLFPLNSLNIHINIGCAPLYRCQPMHRIGKLDWIGMPCKRIAEYDTPAIHEEWRPAMVLIWKDKRGAAKQKASLPEVDMPADDETYIQDEF
ncbi:hypothetical protein [Komagataeibacter medellinensis]|uniref:hypothetical protein n=1 Tax=Komagataeibacter medellinensis TaxID=1177712 RepID=UPI001295BE38|nr:hypothetical protein [Komagataeibacter medellinensis]